jgi:hypothetical protein
MIVYGSKATQLAKETIVDKCPGCGTLNSVELYVFQKYAHVFWIPFFPMGKTGVSQCSHCKQALKLKEMPDGIRSAYENLKAQTKAPVWMFSGLALVAILITVGIINSKQNDARNAKLIAAPLAGDVYEVKTTDGQYTLYKVDNVKSDSVFYLVHQFQTNKSTGLGELKRKGEAAYVDDPYGVTKSELKTMFDKGEIMDVDRK